MPGELPYVEIYTDGACSPNPGLGGWGVVLISPKHGGFRRELSGGQPDTTNNRMELLAAIEGLRALKVRCQVKLVTDSKYVCQAFLQGWLERWKQTGWVTAARAPVKNDDLWRELDRLAGGHQVEMAWVKGHGDDPNNQRADALAVAAREALRIRG